MKSPGIPAQRAFYFKCNRRGAKTGRVRGTKCDLLGRVFLFSFLSHGGQVYAVFLYPVGKLPWSNAKRESRFLLDEVVFP